MGAHGSSDGVLLVVGYSTRTRGVAKAALSIMTLEHMMTTARENLFAFV